MAWNLKGNKNTNPGADFLGTTDNQPLVIKTNGAEAVRVNVAGASSSRLEIAAQDGMAVTGFQPFITLRDANAGNKRSIVQGVDGHIVLIPDSFAGSGAAMVLRSGSGNVGIGTSEPTSRLEIIGQDGMAVTGFQPFITLRDANAGNRRSIVQGVDGHIVLIPDSFAGSGTAAMVVRSGSGDVEMNGNVSVAGDINLTGADCAEYFDVADPDGTEPGAVMSIKADGVLEVSKTPYDRNVAGVASGAGPCRPGLLLDRQESDRPRVPIALVGKVWCLADASSRPIQVGDLLTTSSTPGHAMAAVDREAAFGAVLGKTLTPLAAGTGLVLALVGLG
jgi:hypothetical protein